jgi:hypothetical protein
LLISTVDEQTFVQETRVLVEKVHRAKAEQQVKKS